MSLRQAVENHNKAVEGITKTLDLHLELIDALTKNFKEVVKRLIKLEKGFAE